tara:strand:+ start:931 stop:1848 length:918 start_codon:yes stop_codon:yes gene_type:complete
MRNLLIFLAGMFLSGCSDYKLKTMIDDNPSGLPELDTSSPEALPAPEDTGEIEEDPPLAIDSPIATCGVSPNPVTPPFESATWFGFESYDPGGSDIVSYEWRIKSSPEGSTVSMPAGAGANRAPFIPELAGTYVGELTVTNEYGLSSDPCEATLEAVPAESLWVEMFWEQPQDDMDLHLLGPGGSLETRSDCYYSNCTESAQIFFPMDWGVSGYTLDNPVLDLDDIPGTGPENINIDSPHAGAVYTVVVHDYTGSTPDVLGDNEVTINIYLDGTLAWTDTRTIAGDGSYTHFARIDWTAGAITSL